MRPVRRTDVSDFDLAVVGAGFSGSLLAMAARRLGLSVVLVEKGSHPRFAIGESSSPLANLLLEEICGRYGLDRIRPLTAWGTWRRAYPEINCGLKRGFTFYAHHPGRPFSADEDRGDQLLVAASPNDEVADTHWFRADFDRFLAEEAGRAGAEYLDLTEITNASFTPGNVSLDDRPARPPPHAVRPLRCGCLGAARVPASRARSARDGLPGSARNRGPLHAFLRRPADRRDGDPARDGAAALSARRRRAPPRVSGGLDLGAALCRRHDERGRRGRSGAFAGAGSRGRGGRLAAASGPASDCPGPVRGGSRAIRPFVHARPLPFRSGVAAGPGWALLPSSAAFVDPLLSTGFPLTLLGIERLLHLFEGGLPGRDFDAGLDAYARATLDDADAAARLVSALYAFFDDFPVFTALTHLYFAAASYSEAATRLCR